MMVQFKPLAGGVVVIPRNDVYLRGSGSRCGWFVANKHTDLQWEVTAEEWTKVLEQVTRPRPAHEVEVSGVAG